MSDRRDLPLVNLNFLLKLTSSACAVLPFSSATSSLSYIVKLSFLFISLPPPPSFTQDYIIHKTYMYLRTRNKCLCLPSSVVFACFKNHTAAYNHLLPAWMMKNDLKYLHDGECPKRNYGDDIVW